MVSSILTNNGAMTALQSLKATQKSLLDTQNRISTGLKVSTAKDNAATWAVATAMRSDIANYKQVSENLSVSSSILTTAETAATTIADLVSQVRSKVSSAQNPAVDKAQVQADIDALLAQITTTAQAASFKGVNLVDSSGSQRVLTSVNAVNGVSTAAYTSIANQNLKVESGSMLESLKDLTVLSRADQTFSALNDGVAKIEITTGTALALRAGNKLDIKYVDETDTNRTLTVKLTKDLSTVEDLVNYLNADANFSGKFTADEVSGANDKFTLSARTRDSALRLGALSGSTLSTSAVITAATDTASAVANPWDGAATPAVTGAALNAGIRKLEMTFADKPLLLGDEFIVKVQMVPGDESTIHTYKLKVMGDDYETGDKIEALSDSGDRIYAIAIAAADVTADNVTGKDIATKIQKALWLGTGADAAGATGSNGWNTDHFLATATAGSAFDIEVDSATGKLSILSADATDDLLSFNSSKTDYQALLEKLDTATANVSNAAAVFGTAGNRIDMQKDFLDKLVDTLTTGLGAMVDADMSEEAARLQALQVQEQLGTQALSIANQAPQSILSLFR